MGMIGEKVQQAVLNAGEKEAGCTVHRVTPEVDGGEILAQSKLQVPENINAWDLGGLIFELEKSLLPEVISNFAAGKIR
jgi:phosphoribosylglycinamide formyltransferase-1